MRAPWPRVGNARGRNQYSPGCGGDDETPSWTSWSFVRADGRHVHVHLTAAITRRELTSCTPARRPFRKWPTITRRSRLGRSWCTRRDPPPRLRGRARADHLRRAARGAGVKSSATGGAFFVRRGGGTCTLAA